MTRNRIGAVWLAGVTLIAMAGAAQAHRNGDDVTIHRTPQRASAGASVEVFSNSAIYLTNARDARVYLLDAMEVLDSELSAGLPANERDAQAIVRRRLHAVGAATLASRTRSSAEGIVRAAQYGVDRIPAVVIDGEAVIYGVTDIDAARAIYQRRQRK